MKIYFNENENFKHFYDTLGIFWRFLNWLDFIAPSSNLIGFCRVNFVSIFFLLQSSVKWQKIFPPFMRKEMTIFAIILHFFFSFCHFTHQGLRRVNCVNKRWWQRRRRDFCGRQWIFCHCWFKILEELNGLGIPRNCNLKWLCCDCFLVIVCTENELKVLIWFANWSGDGWTWNDFQGFSLKFYDFYVKILTVGILY